MAPASPPTSATGDEGGERGGEDEAVGHDEVRVERLEDSCGRGARGERSAAPSSPRWNTVEGVTYGAT
jgi:hypothetical protein